MTNEEAIEVMKAYRDRLINSASNQLDGDIEAFDIAIKALEQGSKMGHWLYSGENGADRWTCDNCFDFVEKPTKICPNCRAKMKREDKE